MPDKPITKIDTKAETGRIEAFSDGVFAVIVTLLVLEIHRPTLVPNMLAQELLDAWPAYLAYLLAFLGVGIIWLNHHGLFKHLQKVDKGLNWINLGGLSMTALLPYPTGVMADAFRAGTLDDQRAAVVLYALTHGIIVCAWFPIFPYLHSHPELLKPGFPRKSMLAQLQRPITGILAYATAALLGWYVHPYYALAIFVIMIIYHTHTSEGVHVKHRKS